MPIITLTNAHGTFTCAPYQLDMAVSRYLPNSVNGLVAELNRINPAFDYSDIHYVTEALIMLADAGEH